MSLSRDVVFKALPGLAVTTAPSFPFAPSLRSIAITTTNLILHIHILRINKEQEWRTWQ
jgi:hypothetical protein